MALLTEDEKRAVHLLLASVDSQTGNSGWYAAYMIPTAIFFGYGLYKLDVVAMGIAYISLLGFAIWYLSHAKQYSSDIISAIRKLISENTDSKRN